MEESAIKIITIVWIGLIPLIAILAIFCFVVLALDKHRICHYFISSALVSRLGHSCTVVVILALFALEHWNWPKEMCYVTTWLWITFWIGDLLTVLLYLIFYNLFFGHKLVKKRVRGTLLMFFVWVISLLLGGLPVFRENDFTNYDPAEETCILDLTLSTKSVRIAAMVILIIGPLFCFVLCITINSEFKSIRIKHRLYCKLNSFNVQNGSHKVENPHISNNLNKPSTELINQNTIENGGNQNKRTNDFIGAKEASKCGITDRGNGVKECSYISNTRDTRNIINVLSFSSILLNCLPQLVLYSMEIISEKPSEYTHYILVSFGLVHCLSLPLLICMATHRYCYISVQVIVGVCCHRKKPNKQNAITNTSSGDNVNTSNGTTVQEHIEHIVPVDFEQVHSSPPTEQDKNAKALTPPPLPTSRHPSFKDSPIVVHKTKVIVSEHNESSELAHNGANNEQVREDLDLKHPNGYINKAFQDSSPTVVIDYSETDTSNINVDESIKYVDLDAEKLKNQPKNVLEISALTIVRSNSAAIPPKTNEKDLQAVLKRTSSTSQADIDKNEGPFVEWTDQLGTGTLLMKKIQSGDQSYLSADYHHDNINSDVNFVIKDQDILGDLKNLHPYDDNNEIDDSDEEYETGSSYYDSDSAGWSHMYTTDTDMDTETLERNKDKKLLAKAMAAKRMPSNNSSLGSETLMKKKKAHRKKKKRKKKTKGGKDVEMGLGTALQTMMFMPGAKMTKSSQSQDKDTDAKQELKVDIKNTAKEDLYPGQISPAIGLDGKPIDIPPPPSYAPPPPPVKAERPSSMAASVNRVDDSTQTNVSLKRNSGPVFPSKVLPFQSGYNKNQGHEMQSFSKASSKSFVQKYDQHKLSSENTASVEDAKMNNQMESTDQSTDTNIQNSASVENVNQQEDHSAPDYHPSILSIVKERTKAQKNWQKALTALSITEFLKKAKPSNLGDMDNGENPVNEDEWDDDNSLSVSNVDRKSLKRGVSRASAHTYVNTGQSGIYSSYKSNKSSNNKQVTAMV